MQRVGDVKVPGDTVDSDVFRGVSCFLDTFAILHIGTFLGISDLF